MVKPAIAAHGDFVEVKLARGTARRVVVEIPGGWAWTMTAWDGAHWVGEPWQAAATKAGAEAACARAIAAIEDGARIEVVEPEQPALFATEVEA